MWTKVREAKLFKRYRAIIQRIYKSPNGENVDFDIVEIGESAHVLALTPDKEVVLVKEFRPGPGLYLTELPAGMIDKGESPTEAGIRELVEETGFKGNAQYVTKIFRNPYSTEVMHIIVCTDCVKVTEQQLDASEFIETKLVSLDDFRVLLRSGEPTNAIVGYIGLEHLRLI